MNNALYHGGKLVIVNLQETPLDHYAHLIIHARIQTVMTKLMEKLGTPIPDFRLNRWADISLKDGELSINGLDADGGPYSLFKEVIAKYDEKAQNQKIKMKF